MKKLIELSLFIHDLLLQDNYIYNSRIRKTDIISGFLFNLLYTQKGKTQDVITGDLNCLNERYVKDYKSTSRQAFLSRNKKLTVDFYKGIYDKISDKINSLFYKDKYSYEVLAVDGTDNSIPKSVHKDGYSLNKNQKSITSLNLGIYNVTRNYPVILEMVKHKNERRAFIDFFNNTDKFRNCIFVTDRGFDGEKCISKLEQKGCKYICRIKGNSTWVRENESDHVYSENGTQRRIVTYTINKNKYYLATNLFDKNEFTIDKIKQIYHSRWSAEELFKYVKSNFNFTYMNLQSEDSIKKSIYGQLITMRIAYLLNKINEKKIDGSNRIINKKTLTSGLYREFLYLLIQGKLNRKRITSFMNSYITIILTNKGKHVPRTCCRPYMKWYIKQYFKKYTQGTAEIT